MRLKISQIKIFLHRGQQRRGGGEGVHLLHVPGRGAAEGAGRRDFPHAERHLPALHLRHRHGEHHAGVRGGAADHHEAEPRQVHERLLRGQNCT